MLVGAPGKLQNCSQWGDHLVWPQVTFDQVITFDLFRWPPGQATGNLLLTYQSGIVEREAKAPHLNDQVCQGGQGAQCINVFLYSENLNGEVGVEHVEAKVDEEVVDADRHQSRIKLELHLDQLKFAFDQWVKK